MVSVIPSVFYSDGVSQHLGVHRSRTHLCHGGEAGVRLGGSDLQQVEVVAALIVNWPG